MSPTSRPSGRADRQALTLRYKPVDLDVLPLYIVLVLAAPLVLWAWCAGRT